MHPGRPGVFVSYRLLGLEGIGWANTEAEADDFAKHELARKLRQKAQMLLSEANQFNTEADNIEGIK